MYFEFNNHIPFKKIQTDYFNGIDVVITPREGAQEEAINNCSNQSKSLVINSYFELGEPRKVFHKKYSLTNESNKNIPLNHKEQIVHIIGEVKKGTYKSLKDIEKDYPYTSYKERILLQDILNRNLPFDSLNVQPARVIWLFGRHGSRKTTWTDKFLREQGYRGFVTTVISPPSLVYNDMVYFKLDDQNRGVLVLNEVD